MSPGHNVEASAGASPSGISPRDFRRSVANLARNDAAPCPCSVMSSDPLPSGACVLAPGGVPVAVAAPFGLGVSGEAGADSLTF